METSLLIDEEGILWSGLTVDSTSFGDQSYSVPRGISQGGWPGHHGYQKKKSGKCILIKYGW